jgi:hypothetical protein
MAQSLLGARIAQGVTDGIGDIQEIMQTCSVLGLPFILGNGRAGAGEWGQIGISDHRTVF